jgi:hypothetical protein
VASFDGVTVFEHVLGVLFWIVVIGGIVLWRMSMKPEEKKLRRERGRIKYLMKKASRGPLDHSRSGGHGYMKPRPAQREEYKRLALRLEEVNRRIEQLNR